MTIGTSWLSKSARSLRMMCALGLAATAFSPPATAADLQTEPINLSKATALGDSDYAKAWNLGRLGVTTIEGAPDHGSATFDAWKVLSTRMDFGLNYHQPAVDASCAAISKTLPHSRTPSPRGALSALHHQPDDGQ